MKILILANSMSGLYEFRRELVLKLRQLGHSLNLMLPTDESYSSFFVDAGCEMTPVDFNRQGLNPFADLKLFLSYYKFLKRYRPDIVFTYTIKPNVYGGFACSLLNIPYVVNVTGLGSALENGGFLMQLSLFLYRLGLRKAKTVFCQNKSNLFFLQNHKVVRENGALIPGSGVNLDYFVAQPYNEDDGIKFLYVGRVMKAKGIDQFLEAAKAITSKFKNVEFHIVGRCEDEYQEILNDLQTKKIVVYHGMQKDMRAFYKMASCTIHASYYAEGMSNVLLETCASARSVITTNRPGCGEIVDDGVNGFVVKQRDSQDLIEKIEKFLALTLEEKQKMGEAGRAKVEKEFDRQIVVNAYLKELENV